MSATSLSAVMLHGSTVEQYNKNYRRLVKKTSEDQRISIEEVKPTDVAQKYLQVEPELAQSTARMYRASLSFVFRQANDSESLAAHDLIYRKGEDSGSVEKLRESIRAKRKLRRQESLRTSAQKTKSLSPGDLKVLQDALARSRSKYARATLLWFECTILTGLRPCEWVDARLEMTDNNQLGLVVKNAKSTQGRSHGEKRRIGLEELCKKNLDLIEEHIDNVSTYRKGAEFEGFYKACRELLRIVTKKTWPRRRQRPTLYTARHIFSAAAKANFDRIEVAALMGHASTETAYLHYGRRSNPVGGIQVKPDASDIAEVAKRNPQNSLCHWFEKLRQRLRSTM